MITDGTLNRMRQLSELAGTVSREMLDAHNALYRRIEELERELAEARRPLVDWEKANQARLSLLGPIPACTCLSTSPTYPEFRENPHVESCVVRRTYESAMNLVDVAIRHDAEWGNRVKQLERENAELKAKADKAQQYAGELKRQLDSHEQSAGVIQDSEVLTLEVMKSRLRVVRLREALNIAKDIIVYFGGVNPETWLPVETAKEWEKVVKALAETPAPSASEVLENLDGDVAILREALRMRNDIESKAHALFTSPLFNGMTITHTPETCNPFGFVQLLRAELEAALKRESTFNTRTTPDHATQ